MSDLNCILIKELLPLYIDDVVSSETKALIEEHLSHCEDCRKEFEILTQNVMIPDNVSARLNEAKPLQSFKKRMKSKRVLAAAVLLIMSVIIIIALSNPAIISRGNPIPYISAAISLNRETPFVLVDVQSGTYDIYMTKDRECEELIQYIESIWNMKLVERVDNLYFFSKDENVMLVVPTERYWGSYTVWAILSPTRGMYE